MRTVRRKLAEWIDNGVLADAVAGSLEEEGVAATEENCQAVWLDFLESELTQGLRSSVDAMLGNGKLKGGKP